MRFFDCLFVFVLSICTMLSAYGYGNRRMDLGNDQAFVKHNVNDAMMVDDGEEFWSMRKILIERNKEKIYKKWLKKMKFRRREDPKAYKHFLPKKPYKNKRKYFTDRAHMKWLKAMKDFNQAPSYIRLEDFSGTFVTLYPLKEWTTRRGTRWWTFTRRLRLKEIKEQLRLSRTFYKRGKQRLSTAPRRRSPRTRTTKPTVKLTRSTAISLHQFFGKFNLI